MREFEHLGSVQKHFNTFEFSISPESKIKAYYVDIDLYNMTQTPKGLNIWQCPSHYKEDCMLYDTGVHNFMNTESVSQINEFLFGLDLVNPFLEEINFSNCKFVAPYVDTSYITDGSMKSIFRNEYSQYLPSDVIEAVNKDDVDINLPKLELLIGRTLNGLNVSEINLPNLQLALGSDIICEGKFSEVVLGDALVGNYGGIFYDCSNLDHITLPAVPSFGWVDGSIKSATFTKGNYMYSLAKTDNFIKYSSSYNNVLDLSPCSDLTQVDFYDWTWSDQGPQPSDFSGIGSHMLKDIILPDCVENIGDITGETPLYNYVTQTQSINVSSPVDGSYTGHIWCSNSMFYLGTDTNPYFVALGPLRYSTVSQITADTFADGTKILSPGILSGYEMSVLTKIELPEGITNVPCMFFNGCYSVTSITLPNTLKYFGYGNFSFFSSECIHTDEYGNHYLGNDENNFLVCGVYNTNSSSTVTFKEGTRIVGGGFPHGGISYIQHINFPSTVINIGLFTFMSCNLLTSVELPESLEVIESMAFMNTGLTELSLPSTLESIGQLAFANTHLSELRIPENVQYIGKNAFQGISELSKVFIDTSALNVIENDRWLNNCSYIETVYCKEGVPFFYQPNQVYYLKEVETDVPGYRKYAYIYE